MEKMRELVQHSTSGSTELAAAAEQMSKLSRALLETIDRFVIESNNGYGQRVSARRNEPQHARGSASPYAEVVRS
jgi:hypothetical protein